MGCVCDEPVETGIKRGSKSLLGRGAAGAKGLGQGHA